MSKVIGALGENVGLQGAIENRIAEVKPYIDRLASKHFIGREDREDAVSAAVLRCLAVLQKDPDMPLCYLWRTARNRIIDMVRDTYRQPKIAHFDQLSDDDPEWSIETSIAGPDDTFKATDCALADHMQIAREVGGQEFVNMSMMLSLGANVADCAETLGLGTWQAARTKLSRHRQRARHVREMANAS